MAAGGAPLSGRGNNVLTGGTCREQEINLQAYLVSLREKGRKLLLAWELLGFVSFGESAGWKKLGEKERMELILSQTKRPGKEVTLGSWSKSMFVMESQRLSVQSKRTCACFNPQSRWTARKGPSLSDQGWRCAFGPFPQTVQPSSAEAL